MKIANTPDALAARAEILGNFRQQLLDALDEQEAASRIAGPARWIVECGALSLAFEDAKPHVCVPWKATRYTRQEAQRQAARVCNGNGAKGTAVSLVDALHAFIGQLQESIETIEGAGQA